MTERLRELSARLDHLQADHPFPFNLVTGGLLGLLLVLLGVAWPFGALYALSWAVGRTLLGQPGRTLRRRYEARQVRVGEQEAERRAQGR
jgi:hypothetical protein